MSQRTLFVLAVLALAGCNGGGSVSAPADTGSGSDGGSGTDTGTPVGEPTYYGQVDDILAAHCWGCHSADGGGIAPFRLDTFPSAHASANAIASATTARIMPPFYAVNDGSCQSFEDHGRWLSDAEIATLSTWAANGAPEGDPSTPAPMRMTPPTLDAPTFTIQGAAPYTPVTTSASPNEIRCFVVDPAQSAASFITAYEVVPGVSSIVHHVIVYEPETDAAATNAAAMEGADGHPGYACNGGAVVPSHPVALWAPGAHRVDYPTGTGLPLPAGRRLIIQIHYNTANAPAAPDQTAIRFLTQPTVPTPALMMLLSQNSLALPPHMSSVSSTPQTLTAPANGRIWGVFPHMHVTGRHLGLTITHGGATSCLTNVQNWDFNWQQAYFFSSPVSASRGDEIAITCTYDTSTRDVMTTFGEGTENEMCLSFFYVTGP
jgi:hypothetical protein